DAWLSEKLADRTEDACHLLFVIPLLERSLVVSTGGSKDATDTTGNGAEGTEDSLLDAWLSEDAEETSHLLFVVPLLERSLVVSASGSKDAANATSNGTKGTENSLLDAWFSKNAEKTSHLLFVVPLLE